jgi:hypothetical protein
MGIEVARSRNGIFLSQRKYVLDLLKETWILGCKVVDIPIEQNKKFEERNQRPLVNKGKYQWVILCLT